MGSLPAFIGIFRQTGLHNPVERRREQRLELADRFRIGVHDGGDQGGSRRPIEGAARGAHFVKQRPQGENVGPTVGVLAFELLRRHIPKSADDDPFFGQRFRHGGRASVAVESYTATEVQSHSRVSGPPDWPVRRAPRLVWVDLWIDGAAIGADGLCGCLPVDGAAGVFLRRRRVALQEAEEERFAAAGGALRGEIRGAVAYSLDWA